MRYIYIFLSLISTLPAMSQKLELGDLAPDLKTGEWIKGNKIDHFQKGEIYVLEFWATWCVPCKEAIPHLSKLAGKYANGITFIGVSVFEDDVKNVKPYVDQMGNKMSYNVVVDSQLSDTSKQGFMTENWLRPLGITGIPATVVVGKTGLIEWVGRPMDLEPVLQRLIKGNWDAGLFLKRKAAMDSVSKMQGNIGDHPNWAELRNNISNKYPYISADSSISVLKITHYRKDFSILEPILLGFLRQYGKSIPMDNLNSYAWTVFSNSTNKELIKLATEILGYKLKSQENANSLDTYAGLLYKAGRKKRALEQQMKAYALVSGEEPMMDLKDGSIIFGAKKANFLITALKMEKDIPIWEKGGLDTIGDSYKKELVYWNRLKSRMLSAYSLKEADSLIAYTQMRFYKLNKQWNNYSHAVVKYAEQLNKQTPEQINSQAWDVFLHSEDKKILNVAASWMIDVVKRIDDPNVSAYIDTYANLLYKLGKKKEALTWQLKAVEHSPIKDKASYLATLKKIENGERTW